MLNKFLKVVIAAVILSASGYASIATAGFVETERSLKMYAWTATCYDCNWDTMGATPNEEEWTIVNGTLTLAADYSFGTAITLENFVSFNYAGESKHLVPFTFGDSSADFSVGTISGQLFEDATFNLDITATNTIEAPLPPPQRNIYQPQDVTQELVGLIARFISTRCADIGSDICRDSIVPAGLTLPHNLMTMYVNRQVEQLTTLAADLGERDRVILPNEAQFVATTINLAPPGLFNLFVLNSYEVTLAEYRQTEKRSLAVSTFGWRISLPGLHVVADLGDGFVVDVPYSVANAVPEPSTLAIFVLGFMGLGLRRIKKQS